MVSSSTNLLLKSIPEVSAFKTLNKGGWVWIKKEKIKSHLRVVHGDKKFECDQCGYKTSTKHNLFLHTKRVHDRKPLKEVCPECKKECVNLEWHTETYHTRVC